MICAHRGEAAPCGAGGGRFLETADTGPYGAAVNRVFVALILSAVVVGLARDALPAEVVGAVPDGGVMKAITTRVLDGAADAARLALGLVGVLALWTGIMRVAEKAGLVALIARALRPMLVRLFPEVPPEHPAMGAIVMNMSANLLGLGNAATPLGLQAMKHLQDLNPHKKTATNAMVLFLALNTTHLTLIPARTIALRLENGSTSATSIVLPTIIATACGMFVAIVLAKLLEKRFPVTSDDDATPATTDAMGGAA